MGRFVRRPAGKSTLLTITPADGSLVDIVVHTSTPVEIISTERVANKTPFALREEIEKKAFESGSPQAPPFPAQDVFMTHIKLNSDRSG